MMASLTKTELKAVERARKACERAAKALDGIPMELWRLAIIIPRTDVPDTTCHPSGLQGGLTDLARTLSFIEERYKEGGTS